jgi:periplasmic divalent cation tolerance protein
MSENGYIVVLTTCAGEMEARGIAAGLIENRLSACVQSSTIQSVYRWQGKIENASEIRLMIKAKTSDYARIEALIKLAHPYDNPEIIALPVLAGSQAYLDWISEETRREIE